jgi:chromatin assembly factor 1 subunit B
MKVETPQILWHDTHNMSAKDNGKSFPILSCHITATSVLATAGGCEINLWNVVSLPAIDRSTTSSGILSTSHHTNTGIQHLLTLSRGTNERTINCVRFSPDQRHLAAVGDGGLVVVWTLPETSSWSTLREEKELKFKIIYNQSDDVMDLSWSMDNKRLCICSLDHTVAVFEYDGMDWKAVFKSTKDHGHYVQGVAMDPKGVYMASMGSDRSVKVYGRKLVKEEEDLDGKKFELGKCKSIKMWCSGEESCGGENSSSKKEKKHLFADELTLGSFFRRLAWTPDGAFLIVPAGLWHGVDSEEAALPSAAGGSPRGVDKLSEASFGTYMFVRHAFEKPYKVLAGLDKVGSSFWVEHMMCILLSCMHACLTLLFLQNQPSVVVRPNPLLFKLPANVVNESKLPHRSIFAVLTIDTILIYDTIHDQPLAMARGLHYASLTDAAWSADGMTLFVTSSDGYVSILSFANGELGEAVIPLEKEEEKESPVVMQGSAAPAKEAAAPINILAPKKKKKVTLNMDANVTTEIENVRETAVVNTLVPKKKKKITPTPVAESGSDAKRPQEEVVNVLVPKKKAKVEGKAADIEQVNVLVPEKTTEAEVISKEEVNVLVPKKKSEVASTPVASSS